MSFCECCKVVSRNAVSCVLCEVCEEQPAEVELRASHRSRLDRYYTTCGECALLGIEQGVFEW